MAATTRRAAGHDRCDRSDGPRERLHPSDGNDRRDHGPDRRHARHRRRAGDVLWRGDDDLDLHVIDPDGTELYYDQPSHRAATRATTTIEPVRRPTGI